MSTTSLTMQTATIGDHELAYRATGEGEAVVLVHGGFAAELLAGVEQAEALGGFRRVLYHRQGHGHSPRPEPIGPLTLEDQADDLIGLLDHLGIDAAHLVGHSLGALVALTTAAAHPDRVRSLTLLEPPVPFSHPAGAEWLESMGPVVERYGAGDVGGAMTAFYDATLREGWRERMERVAPDAFEDSVDGAPMGFESDMPGMAWTDGLSADQVTAVRCPVLLVVGGSTRPVFADAREVVRGWFPWCEDLEVAGADHMLPVLAPDTIAEAVARHAT
ncbi:pimeloyl-ACP methyl ester carboxylesterase [Mumia flava]|uniref:Pimeloyl-ACP methyl ester carboxylesterase n=1 Tax=Mumia flava TaxID=1348852 RepID=A0A2M9BJT1_9ACTN|nr:alpha/beta hydrolase [Mumia flava]PJJ58223.1 pimeloyl-ACP methyl ester carboxylesterase [Mumia flava]